MISHVYIYTFRKAPGIVLKSFVANILDVLDEVEKLWTNIEQIFENLLESAKVGQDRNLDNIVCINRFGY
jgi:hypothetical protein